MPKEFKAWLCGNWAGTISKEQQRRLHSPSDYGSPMMDSFEVQRKSCPWQGSTECAISHPPWSQWWCDSLPAAWKASSDGTLVLWPGTGSGGQDLSSKCKVNFHEIVWTVIGCKSETPIRRFSQAPSPYTPPPQLLWDAWSVSCGHKSTLKWWHEWPWCKCLSNLTQTLGLCSQVHWLVDHWLWLAHGLNRRWPGVNKGRL